MPGDRMPFLQRLVGTQSSSDNPVLKDRCIWVRSVPDLKRALAILSVRPSLKDGSEIRLNGVRVWVSEDMEPDDGMFIKEQPNGSFVVVIFSLTNAKKKHEFFTA